MMCHEGLNCEQTRESARLGLESLDNISGSGVGGGSFTEHTGLVRPLTPE